jgi:hypothetical protein
MKVGVNKPKIAPERALTNIVEDRLRRLARPSIK